jgi:hypothetical protein
LYESNGPVAVEALIEDADRAHEQVCIAQREFFRLIAEMDRVEAWADHGARDMAHWLWMRYGVSDWKARRWIACAHALESLPFVSRAFASGAIGVDKVVELTRFATPSTEERLLAWAERVSPFAIRRKGDLLERRQAMEAAQVERDRFLRWKYFDDGRRFALEGELSAADGAVVSRALDRIASTLPELPGEEGLAFIDARRADALRAVCGARIAHDADPDRATVVVHTSVATLAGDTDSFDADAGGSEIDGGPVLHPTVVRRLACTARLQVVEENASGDPLRMGRTTREPSTALLRAVRHRDGECVFPGCGARRFTEAHHVLWWSLGGPTDIDNLVLICGTHHRLVHEYGWRLRRIAGGAAEWFRPDGSEYRAGPSPPRQGEMPIDDQVVAADQVPP